MSISGVLLCLLLWGSLLLAPSHSTFTVVHKDSHDPNRYFADLTYVVNPGPIQHVCPIILAGRHLHHFAVAIIKPNRTGGQLGGRFHVDDNFDSAFFTVKHVTAPHLNSREARSDQLLLRITNRVYHFGSFTAKYVYRQQAPDVDPLRVILQFGVNVQNSVDPELYEPVVIYDTIDIQADYGPQAIAWISDVPDNPATPLVLTRNDELVVEMRIPFYSYINNYRSLESLRVCESINNSTFAVSSLFEISPRSGERNTTCLPATNDEVLSQPYRYRIRLRGDPSELTLRKIRVGAAYCTGRNVYISSDITVVGAAGHVIVAPS